ncbi:thiamine-phosphate kinase [Candidatus Poriferisodalis sp.]|uniref:thiamine-phosphate kinase n=1 Tax=Candidatus Poriferisodalis sp. TaxID=3101277 RepID=UPI003B527CE2
MNDVSAIISDEPTRIASIIGRYVMGQSDSLVATSDDVGVDVRLQTGADQFDDCAVYSIGTELALVAGSDFVRGVGFSLFELGLLTLRDIGYYLVAANMSDVASMGAIPIGLLSVIRYPSSLTDDEFGQLIAGINSACTDFGVLNVGGDIGGAERVYLSATGLGMCHQDHVLLRSGAEHGDLVAVTGTTGLAGTAMAYFTKKDESGWSVPVDTERQLLDSWRHPQAQVLAGRVLGSQRLASACQDSSDGLKATLEQISEASGVQIAVDAHRVPVHPAVAAVAHEAGVDALDLTFGNSVDFQLVFTFEPAKFDRLSAAFKKYDLQFHIIGEVMSDRGETGAFLRFGEELEPLPGVAWRHQMESSSEIAAEILGKR